MKTSNTRRRATPRSAATKRRSQSPRDGLAQTFLARSTRLLNRLAAKARAETLKQALAQPTDLGGLTVLLSEFALAELPIDRLDPLADALARGVAVKHQLLKRAGGAWSAGRVAGALGLTRQAVDKRRTRGTLLGLPTGSGDYVYPRAQFTRRGVLRHVPDALQACRTDDPWTRLAILLEPADALGGRSVLQALRDGDVEPAIAVARSVGDTHDDRASPA